MYETVSRGLTDKTSEFRSLLAITVLLSLSTCATMAPAPKTPEEAQRQFAVATCSISCVMEDLDARLTEAVSERLEQRASERLALPTGLPELPKDASTSLPAAPAREGEAEAAPRSTAEAALGVVRVDVRPERTPHRHRQLPGTGLRNSPEEPH